MIKLFLILSCSIYVQYITTDIHVRMVDRLLASVFFGVYIGFHRQFIQETFREQVKMVFICSLLIFPLLYYLPMVDTYFQTLLLNRSVMASCPLQVNPFYRVNTQAFNRSVVG